MLTRQTILLQFKNATNGNFISGTGNADLYVLSVPGGVVN